MHHGSARLTVFGRRMVCLRVIEEGWTVTKAAWAAGVSRQTASKWVERYRSEGEQGLLDRSTRPHRSPTRLPLQLVKKVVRARVRLQWGPHRLGWSLGLPRSSIYAILRRLGLSRRSSLRPREPARHYEWPAPGDLLHLDTKRLGRIGPGPTKHFTGPQVSHYHRGIGSNVVHVAIDDHSRLAYAEERPDELAPTATAFTMRAFGFFEAYGIKTRRVLTDNGPCYRSRLFNDTLESPGVRTMRTRPYTPRTNGKAEAMVGTLLRGWAYRRPYESTGERIEALPRFLQTYNHHLPHGGLDGARPIDRVRQ
jgi:transposase InsO family protein